MVKKGIIFSVLVFFAVSLSGCATAAKRNNLEIHGLRNQLAVLDTQIQAKNEEIDALREALVKATEEKAAPVKQPLKKKVVCEIKSRPNIKQIQIALANAGFDPGSIDGKKGKLTRDAIKAFQRANNLSVDGKVGRETWDLLKGYLYKKVK